MLDEPGAGELTVALRVARVVCITEGVTVVAPEPDIVLLGIPDDAQDVAKLLAPSRLVPDDVRTAEDVVVSDGQLPVGIDGHAIRVAALVDGRIGVGTVPVALAIVLHAAVPALVAHEYRVRRTAGDGDDLEELRTDRIGTVRHVAVGPQPVVHGETLERRRARAHEEETVLAARDPDVAGLVSAHAVDVMRAEVLRSVEGPARGCRRWELHRRRRNPHCAAVLR